MAAGRTSVPCRGTQCAESGARGRHAAGSSSKVPALCLPPRSGGSLANVAGSERTESGRGSAGGTAAVSTVAQLAVAATGFAVVAAIAYGAPRALRSASPLVVGLAAALAVGGSIAAESAASGADVYDAVLRVLVGLAFVAAGCYCSARPRLVAAAVLVVASLLGSGGAWPARGRARHLARRRPPRRGRPRARRGHGPRARSGRVAPRLAVGHRRQCADRDRRVPRDRDPGPGARAPADSAPDRRGHCRDSRGGVRARRDLGRDRARRSATT